MPLSTSKKSFSTDSVPPEDRLSYWEKLVSDIFTRFEVELDGIPSEDFVGSVIDHSTEDLGIFEISSQSPHRVRHPGGGAYDSQNSAIVITLQVEGSGKIYQDGRQDIIQPGDITLFDASRQFDLHFDGPIRQLSLSIPWQSVQRQLISPKKMTGIGISGSIGVGSVASEFVNTFAKQAANMAATEREGLMRSLVDIINAAVISRLASAKLSKSDYSDFQLNTARVYVEENLRDPDLSPAVVAAAMGVSQRYLNKMFESENQSLNRMIWERRLENSRIDLENPGMDGRSITDIALSWGFKSSSHFSRSFRELFQMSPREVRLQRG
jgi:AraC-like DNA-binding protein